jgi:hypothetical protein
VFKFAFSKSEPAKTASALNLAASDHELSTVGANTPQDTLTKGSRLEVAYAYVCPASEVKLTPINYTPDPQPQSAPPVVVRKIISRHWHDPSDPKARQARDQKSKHKEAKKGPANIELKATTEASLCPSNGFDAIRQAFDLSPSCRQQR